MAMDAFSASFDEGQRERSSLPPLSTSLKRSASPAGSSSSANDVVLTNGVHLQALYGGAWS